LEKNELSGAIKTMEYNCADLLEELTFLEQLFYQLSIGLSKAASQLQEPGIPLSEKLILEIESARRNFVELRDRVIKLAEYSGISPIPKPDEIVSRRHLETLLHAIADTEKKKSEREKVRSSALKVIEKILAIAHRVESNFQPLQECYKKASELYLAISDSQESDLHPDTQNLAEGNHPFSKLLKLISDLEDLDDECLADLQDAVTESFGRNLAMAAVRGKLIIREEFVQNLPSLKGDRVAARVEPTEAEISQEEQQSKEESNWTQVEAAIATPNNKIIPDSQPVETLIATLETVTLPPTIETEKSAPSEQIEAELEKAVKETRKFLEDNVALGLLRETERLDYVAQIESTANSVTTTLRFSEKLSHLQAINDGINSKRQETIDDTRKKLIQELGQENPAYARICSVLDKGDVLSANEYIDMVQQGRPIPEAETTTDAFIDFFKNKYAALENVLEPADRNRTIRRELINEIAKGRSIGLLQMQQVPGAQAKQASEMLEAWFTAKGKKQAITEEDVRKILSYLGFNTAQIAINPINQVRNYIWIDVTTEPIQDKKRCPVPAYGSEAKGRYRILCVWDRPSEEDILNAVGDTSVGSRALVFHFGRMTEKRRRDLARLCRERRRTFIVIDDVVMFYLCGERGARLPILFECTLPFTFLEPYTTTSGFVPPEMFYGRERERDSIIAATGSCFIYGGRQLGKTVLLRSVERTFHSPTEGKIALWIDLKAQAIGYDRDIDEIWNLLATEFKHLGVIPDSKSTRVKADELLKQIQTWLAQDENRQILLLLDEADRFLEADGKQGDEKGEFIRSARLKGLMDKTNRRFKVVFAGLHNVQRTTKLENHPLAHLGEPICISPLLNNGEMREARSLIERPFASIGYRFESPDLVTRILSQTNYYPSLIQLYCQQLLKHVTNPDVANWNGKQGIPYVISSQQVDEAYQSQDLRKAIRDRFMWTLQLDGRYEVIAYTIAYGSIQSEQGMVDGFNAPWIRNEVLTWWYEGFLGLSLDEIQVLLEEMVGLGVLRVTSTGGFTLRSPNVLLLMGTPEEIEAVLLQPREAPLQYEPGTFRSAIGTKDNSRRSPLTAQQESKLLLSENGVSIVFGNLAAGLDDLKVYLKSLFIKKKEVFYYYWEDISSATDFSQSLKERIRNRQKDGTTLVFVSSACPWNQNWVDEAIGQVDRLRAKNSFVRVVFVADTQKTWQLISKSSTDFISVKKLTTLSLKPWHDAALRQWLQDCNLPSDKVAREKIASVTGNWSTLLYRFYQNAKPNPHQWELHLESLQESLTDGKEARDFTNFDLGIERHEQKYCKLSRNFALFLLKVSCLLRM
jgi:hypothetical protein